VLLLPLVLCGGPWCGLWRPLMHGLWRPLMWALAAPGMGLGGPYFVGFGAFVVSDSDGHWFGLRLPLVWAEVAPGAAVLRTARAVWHCTSDSFQIMC